MSQVYTDVENFQLYRGKENLNSVIGGLLLRILTEGISNSSNAPSATAANQAIAIASLQSLDTDNATEAQQVAIANAVKAMEASLLAEDRATSAKQDLLFAKNEAIRALLVEIEANIESGSTDLIDALGYSDTDTLKADLDTLATKALQNTIVNELQNVQTIIDGDVSSRLNQIKLKIDAIEPEISEIYDSFGLSDSDTFADRLTAIESAIEANTNSQPPDPDPITPKLSIATSSGSLPAGAKFATFTIYPGTTGTILGTAIVPEIEIVDFPFNAAGYSEMPYTITAGTIVITSGT